MIRDSIKKGCKVWHNEYGQGTFLLWYKDMTSIYAVIKFNGENIRAIYSRELNEIEETGRHLDASTIKEIDDLTAAEIRTAVA